MSTTIAIYNFKGGVGKTSTTFSLAQNWSKTFKVLMIDCDPQANLTQSFLNPRQPNTSTLFNILKSLIHNETPNLKPFEIHPYLHLISGDYKMIDLESNSQIISFGRSIFNRLLTSIQNEYDFILFDCPTHFGVTVQSILANVNSILIPAIPDSFSASGFKKLLKYLAGLEHYTRLNILGIFFNQFRKNTLYHNKIVKHAKQELGDLILNQKIRQSIYVSHSIHGKPRPSQLQEEQSKAEDDFYRLSEEVIARINTSELNKIIAKLG